VGAAGSEERRGGGRAYARPVPSGTVARQSSRSPLRELPRTCFARRLILVAMRARKSATDREAWRVVHQDGIFLVMARPKVAGQEDGPVARTIRFPEGLRSRIAADADRCGRSFEGQVIAILRRHYGEDVDIAPAPSEILGLAAASLAGVSEREIGRLTRRLRETESE